jgi:hypothetical protein
MIHQPTVSQFNSWSREDQTKWIETESEGRRGQPGHPEFLLYTDTAMIVRYLRDDKDQIAECSAMPFAEGLRSMRQSGMASGVLDNLN